MPVDFDNNRLICVHFPPGAGGKFLMNCLALTPDVEFQHKDLLSYFTDSQQRYNFLLNKLEKAAGRWNDLNLGCINMLYVEPYYELDSELSQQMLSNDPVLLSLAESNKNWCMVAHQDADIDNLYRKIWPNCRIIRFINFEKFLTLRRYKYIDKHAKSYSNEYIWNVGQCYNSVDNFIQEFNQLCYWLDISTVNAEYLEKIYLLWLSKINMQF